jgi:hypothetical protein
MKSGVGGCIALISAGGKSPVLPISLPGGKRFSGGAIRDLCRCRWPLFLHGPCAPSNKSVFDYADADASMAVGFHLVANDNAFNRSRCAFHWSTKQPHNQADR